MLCCHAATVAPAASKTSGGTAPGVKVGAEIAQFKSHPPAGKGTKFVDMEAVSDMKGPLRKSAPNLPRGFITSIYHTHTARSVCVHFVCMVWQLFY
jgi:hypothetical protein